MRVSASLSFMPLASHLPHLRPTLLPCHVMIRGLGGGREVGRRVVLSEGKEICRSHIIEGLVS